MCCFLLYSINWLETYSIRYRFHFREKKKSHGTKSGEHGWCSNVAVRLSATNIEWQKVQCEQMHCQQNKTIFHNSGSFFFLLTFSQIRQILLVNCRVFWTHFSKITALTYKNTKRWLEFEFTFDELFLLWVMPLFRLVIIRYKWWVKKKKILFFFSGLET